MTRYYSPAKVNLFLRVEERRPDGYHELSSLFQTIDLFDTLDITCCENHDRLAVNDPSIPCDTTNLILKATALFRQKTKSSQYFNIILNKSFLTFFSQKYLHHRQLVFHFQYKDRPFFHNPIPNVDALLLLSQSTLPYSALKKLP